MNQLNLIWQKEKKNYKKSLDQSQGGAWAFKTCHRKVGWPWGGVERFIQSRSDSFRVLSAVVQHSFQSFFFLRWVNLFRQLTSWDKGQKMQVKSASSPIM